MESVLAIVLFFSLCGALLLGFPVAWTLAGISLIFAGLGWILGVFDLSILIAWHSKIFGTMNNATLFAIPLFILMGVILERSNVASGLLKSLSSLFGKRPGGLAVAVTIVSTLLAASTGIVGATVVTMGLLAMPLMLQRGYDASFSCGTIASAGTLGVIIPPSILLVLLGDVLASAYAQAQRDIGNFSPNTISVGDLFAAALLPGLVLATLYMIYQFTRAHFEPHIAPAPSEEIENKNNGAEYWSSFLRMLVAPLALIIAVLGSILAGAATPTEAAAIGAIGASLIAAERLSISHNAVLIILGLILSLGVLKIFGGLSEDGVSLLFILATIISLALVFMLVWVFYLLWRTDILTSALYDTTKMTAMVFAILICAGLFSLVFRGFGGDELIRNALENLPGGKWTAFLLVMLAIFCLGFVLDFIEITLIIVPITAPILIALGFSPIWLGVMIAINLQTSFLTPPFGFALFYLRGVAPASIPTTAIYKGVIPFIAIQLLTLCLVALFPQLAEWLPQKLFGYDDS